MVINDHADLGSLFRRKKKKAPPPKPPLNTNFNFPMPASGQQAMSPEEFSRIANDPNAIVAAGGAPVAPMASGVPASLPKPTVYPSPTVAPTMAGGFQEYLPWIVGGAVLVLGGVLVYLTTRK